MRNICYVSGTAVWGYLIGDKNFSGKGLGTEAAKLILDYAFNYLNLRKITSYNIVTNEATFKLQQKFGFVEEGLLKEQIYFFEKYFDVIVLSLFREKYLQK